MDKHWVYRCPFCPHKDLVGKDFVDHLAMNHSVRLTEPKMARFFMTDRTVVFRKLNYCDVCGLRNNEGATWMNVHRETCHGFKESRQPMFDVTRANIFDWWDVNEAALWWAVYPDLGILPSPDGSATPVPAVKTATQHFGPELGAQQILAPSPRAAWTAGQRLLYETGAIEFAVMAFADVLPRNAATNITRVRVYFEAALSGGIYAVTTDGSQVARMTVRTHDTDTTNMAHMSRQDAVEGMIISVASQWMTVTGYVSFDQPIRPGRYQAQLGARRQGAEISHMTISDTLFLV